MKDFDSWNEKKKINNEKPPIVGVHEREVWWVSLGLNIGIETDGKNEEFERPVLVLKRFNIEMIWILPITSQVKSTSFHENFTLQGKGYYAALTQIRTVSTRRLLRKSGTIPKKDFRNIRKRVMSLLQTNEDPL
jgi:mRNA interferase MazF